MEMLIVFGIVGVPLIVMGLYGLYKQNQEERKERAIAA